MIRRTSTITLAAILASTLSASAAAGGGLPKSVSWTAYGTTSLGYANGVAIGNVLKKNYDTEVRLVPGKNDVSRLVPVEQGKVDLCACGAAAILAQEGVFDFGKKRWGPQRILNIFNNAKLANGTTLALANDIGVKTLSDLKGKRMAWVRGSPALNVNLEGFLAFGGLTWDDVTKVEFPGWKQANDGVINGQADAVIVSTSSPHLQRLAASPRGSIHPTTPHADKEGWARAKAVAPWWLPRQVSVGINMESNFQDKVPYDGMGYPYPAYLTYADRSEDFIYELTKAVVSHSEEIKAALKGAGGYGIKSQVFDWALPYHPGAIKYFKEVEGWGAKEDAHNARLLKRQDVLAAAWKKAIAMNLDDEAHQAKWREIRVAALEAAGMDAPFK